MTAIWPTSLPQKPSTGGYAETAQRPRTSFQADAGPPIERPKGTVKLATISVNFEMNGDQVEQFKTFVDDELRGGVVPFLMIHPRTDSQMKATITGDQPYQISPISHVLWNVAFSMLVQE